MSHRRLPPAARRAGGALLLGVAAYYAVWAGEYSAFDLRFLGQQKTDAAERLAETRHEVDSLKVVADRLDRDPATIEAVARERFGMIRPGELLYRFIPVDGAPPAPDGRVSARTP